jgi:hypothetical protein
MGAAESSNVSSVVTNVSNYVSNSTKADTSQISNIANNVIIDQCNIRLSGDFQTNSMATVIETSNQIVSAVQNTNMKNNIQQQMLQEATSKVGFLGIGYADASNSSNEMINSTNSVTDQVGVTANQYSNTNNNFDCERSTIIADNINIGFNTNTDFLSSQTLQNNQVSNLVNNVTQSVTQKATATVEGMAGLILAIILVFAVIVYGLGAPLSSGSAKIAVNVGMVAGLLGITSFMYVKNTSPFFSKPSNCINHSAIGRGTGSDIPDCTDISYGEINLQSPPARYLYSVLPSGNSVPGGNLLQMSIAQASGQSPGGGAGINGGYRVDTFNNLQRIISSKYATLASNLKIPNVPNPLTLMLSDGTFLYTSTTSSGVTTIQYFQVPKQYVNGVCTPGIIQVKLGSNADGTKCSDAGYPPSLWTNNSNLLTTNATQAIANLNTSQWNDYVNMTGVYGPGIAGWNDTDDDESNVRALFARFVLCDIIGNIDLHVYVNPKEYIKFPSEYNENTFALAGPLNSPTYPNDTYFYHPDNGGSSVLDGFSGTGVLKGKIGYLNNNQYKFEKFMKKSGIAIIIVIILSIMGYMAYTYNNNKSNNNSNKTK